MNHHIVDYSMMNAAPAPLRSDGGRRNAPMTLPSAASFFTATDNNNTDAFASAAAATVTTARLKLGGGSGRRQSNVSFERHSMSLFDDISLDKIESEEEYDDFSDDDEDNNEYDDPSQEASSISIVWRMEEEILADAVRRGKVAYVSDDYRKRRHITFCQYQQQQSSVSFGGSPLSEEAIIAPPSIKRSKKTSKQQRSGGAQDDIAAALEKLVGEQKKNCRQKNSIMGGELGNNKEGKETEIHPLDNGNEEGSNKGMTPPRNTMNNTAAARSLSAEMTTVKQVSREAMTGRTSLARMPLEHFAQ